MDAATEGSVGDRAAKLRSIRAAAALELPDAPPTERMLGEIEAGHLARGHKDDPGVPARCRRLTASRRRG
jgi:hypothetical protein